MRRGPGVDSVARADPVLRSGRAVRDARAAGIPYVDVYLFPCYRCGNPATQVRDTANSIKGYGMIWLDIEVRAPHGPAPAANRQYCNRCPVWRARLTGRRSWGRVPQGTQYWSSSHTNNRNFISGMISEAEKLGVKLGIYTSKSQWEPIGKAAGLMPRATQLTPAPCAPRSRRLDRRLQVPALVYVLLPYPRPWAPPSAVRRLTRLVPDADAHYDDRPSFSDFEAFGGWSKPAVKQYRGTSTLCGAGVDYDWYP